MNDRAKLSVAVVGAGPIGSILSAHLLEAGADVVICDVSQARLDVIGKNGIVLRNSIHKTLPASDTVRSISELSGYQMDLVIIAVKCPYLVSVLEEIGRIDSGEFFLMSAQNGLGTEDDISTLFSADRTLRMVINFAGNLVKSEDETQAGVVNVTFFNPPNYVAAMSDAGRAIEAGFIEALNSAGLTTESSSHIQLHIWEKVILNNALCALCAVTGKTMGEVMSFPSTLQMVEGIIEESLEVAQAEGVELDDDFPATAIDYLNKGGAHKPTMLVDVENGLLTEIDYLNGKIELYGNKHEIATPLNSALTAMVKLVEAGYGDG
ncbi:MAG: hypothetical protein CMF77_01340 [Candidatus Marinimicrobia bacterium]|nr:hypothetical protein [Candidatus Neomarinimicrobiota bacterium]